MNLNLGCFNKKLPGFTNVDIRPDVNPDVLDNCVTLEKFENGSADLIYACHILEHFSKKEAIAAIERWKQILKPNGTLRLAVPDMEAVFAHYFYHKDINTLLNFIYGSQKHDYDFHLTGWTFDSLKKDLIDCGFDDVRIWEWSTTPPHNYCDDYSQCYYPDYTKKVVMSNGKTIDLGGKLMSLNVEATKC